MNRLFLVVISLVIITAACNDQQLTGDREGVISDTVRVVSLNGTLSEIIVGLGMEDNIVGVDVTSTYPASLMNKPKLGHNRGIAAEGVISLAPDVVLALRKDVSQDLERQFKDAGVRTFLFDQEYSPEGTRSFIRAVADSLQAPAAKADSLIARLNADLQQVHPVEGAKPKVLFIYARGTGTMMVAGEDTNVEDAIELAGGVNAISGFKDFKPLTAESLVQANPDVILLFDSGLESLGGAAGLLKVQGVAQTNAGRNKKIVEMDGQLMTGFGPRLGKAMAELSQKIRN
jgi:iron complex transport system substrate-binding protein